VVGNSFGKELQVTAVFRRMKDTGQILGGTLIGIEEIDDVSEEEFFESLKETRWAKMSAEEYQREINARYE
jgi:hypothetical protein